MEERIPRGIFPIVYTPFREDGSIDEEDVRRLVAYLIDAGTHGLAPCGGGSEAPKMGLDERMWLAGVVADEAAGRVPLVVGVSAARSEDSVILARQAASLGALAVFATPRPDGGSDLPALREHYAALCRGSPVPVMLQDANPPVAPADVAVLAGELPNLRYVKEEAADSGHRITELRRLDDRLRILSGGSYLLDDLARGAIGAIPGSVGVADLARAFDLFEAGDARGARAAFDHFLPLSFWRRQFALLGAKEVLRRIGVFKVAVLRDQGSQHLDEYDHRELSALMEAMGPPF